MTSVTSRTVAALSYPALSLDDVTGPSGQELGKRAFIRALEYLGLDRQHMGTRHWNPIGQLVKKGATVLVKPNWVHHKNLKVPGEIGLECLVTSPAFILEAVRLSCRAVGKNGQVIVGDSPIQGCDLDQVIAMHGVGDKLLRMDFGAPVRIADFRRTRAELDPTGYPVRQFESPGDPEGYRIVGLGSDSRLAPLDATNPRYAVPHYSPEVTALHHKKGVHEYLLTGVALKADLIICLPKLKTHEKSGLTCCMKNLVGLNGNKEWLPHYRIGPPELGGDEVPSCSMATGIRLLLEDLETRLFGHAVLKQLVRAARISFRMITRDQPISGGAWEGNDTLWRMVVDLNRALLYADRFGYMQDQPQRLILNVVDALLAGEGHGPLRPTPKVTGVVLAGFSPLAVDYCAAVTMGLDPLRIPTIRGGFEATRWPLALFLPHEIQVSGDFQGPVSTLPVTPFRMPPGWIRIQ